MDDRQGEGGRKQPGEPRMMPGGGEIVPKNKEAGGGEVYLLTRAGQAEAQGEGAPV